MSSKILNKVLRYNKKIINTKEGIKNNINAMYTIEAALLFPIILFIVFGGICISFFAHDMTVAGAESNRCCNEAAGQGWVDSDFENRIESAVSKRLILGKVKKIKVSKKGECINISIVLHYDMIFWKFKKTETFDIAVNEVNIPDYLRKVQIMADELEKMIE